MGAGWSRDLGTGSANEGAGPTIRCRSVPSSAYAGPTFYVARLAQAGWTVRVEVMIMRTRVLAPLAAFLLMTILPAGDAGVAAAEPLPPPGPSVTPVPDMQVEPTALPEVTGAAEYDACFLVTDPEMEGLFHRHLLEPPTGAGAGGAHDCLWSFQLDPTEMAAAWLGKYDGWASLAGLPVEAIDGVGDEALWVLGGLLYVRSGASAFTVMVISDTLDAKDTAIAIARLAVPRHPLMDRAVWCGR